jgi:hypothetical protein
MKHCRGYGCTSTALIDAHIIGRGFARMIMGDGKHNVKVSLDRTVVTHHGVYDRKILCARCDGVLGKYDDYAIKVCRRFVKEHRPSSGGRFVLEGVDGDCFAKFVLSVLWRASISDRPECHKVKLGPYDDLVRDVLFGAKSLAELKSYRLYVARYQSAKPNPPPFYLFPEPMRVDQRNGWGFVLNGFRIEATLDQRPDRAEMGPYVVNGSDRLVGLFVDLESTTEYAAMLAMGRNQRIRDLRRSNCPT